jgi:1-acyl-sn-glycerol-3-phosphate acyltransferase
MYGSGIVLSLAGLVLWKLAPRRLAMIPSLWSRICLRALALCCGTRLRMINPELLPAGKVVIAAQHQSALDILIWLAILPRPAFVFKQELMKIPLFGALLMPAGMIPVDREGAAPALRKMVTACRAALAEGRQVIIFPEGTRVAPGARGHLHPGVVALARATYAPVIPAATDSGLRWGARAFGKTPGPVTVKLFPPLTPGMRREDLIAELTEVFYEKGVK